MKDEKEIVWTEDMGFMPPVKKIEGRTICRVECQLSEYKEEIERLREALTWIERHPVEESKQWEVAVKEMKRLARSALPQKETE